MALHTLSLTITRKVIHKPTQSHEDSAMKYQTEAEAFRAVAKEFASGNPKMPCICDQITETIGGGWQHNRNPELCSAMRERIALHLSDMGLPKHEPAYGRTSVLSSTINRNDEARALACLWMALEAEEEG